ncbi:MAG TPA: carbohydrate ABC transporter substrate-binding protein [Firmicutes bacterium]|nr:carbohydrate ABC transporter substrate-binding protein [Bacillota bacterium]
MKKPRFPVIIKYIFICALLAAGTGLLIWWQPWVPRIWVGDVKINPHADIDEDKNYTVTLWESSAPLLGYQEDREEKLAAVIAEFERSHPNIKINVQQIPLSDLESTLRDALAAASPPDIVSMPERTLYISPELQIPLELYLSDEEAGDLHPAAMKGASAHGHLWAFPRYIQPQLWAIRLDAWQALAGELPENIRTSIFSSSQPEDKNSLPGFIPMEVWTEILANSRTKQGSLGLAGNVYDPLFFAGILMASTGLSLVDEDGRLQWPKEMLVEAISHLRYWMEKKLMPNDLYAAARSRLGRFWNRQVLALTPLTPWLWHHLWQRSGIPSASAAGGGSRQGRAGKVEEVMQIIAWTPPPHLSSAEGWLPVTVPGYAVFRQAPYKGDDHTRATVAAAAYLSRQMGLWEAIRIYGVPAHPSAVTDWLDGSNIPSQSLEALLDWTDKAARPAVDDAAVRTEQRLLGDRFIADLVKALQGELTPAEFADRLHSASNTLAAVEVLAP